MEATTANDSIIAGNGNDWMFICINTLNIFLHIDCMEFPHAVLKADTDDFSSRNTIGEGGFGKVFRGRVYHCDVAIKLLSDVSAYILVHDTLSLE